MNFIGVFLLLERWLVKHLKWHTWLVLHFRWAVRTSLTSSDSHFTDENAEASQHLQGHTLKPRGGTTCRHYLSGSSLGFDCKSLWSEAHSSFWLWFLSGPALSCLGHLEAFSQQNNYFGGVRENGGILPHSLRGCSGWHPAWRVRADKWGAILTTFGAIMI